ncbi:MAG: protein kinase [Verrucomicrobiae bacterium]|nr:protein kinase [Verrucomicrobiae bacterium]
MSSSISSSPGSSLVFFSRSGTQAQAKTKVKRLRNTLLAREQSEPGFLGRQLILLEQSSFRKPAEWHWTSFPSNQAHDLTSREKEQTRVYVKSLLEAAYPATDFPEMEEEHQRFTSYLQREDQDETLSNPLNAEKLLNHIQSLHLIQVKQEAFEAGEKKGALPFAQDEPKKIKGSVLRFLEHKEVVPCFSQQLGEGNFGVVVSAAVKGEEGKYVYKQEKREVLKALTKRGSSFWREGDCAAARLNDISDLTRPLFFIFRTSQEGKPEELHYVPANHVKAFGMKLPPGTTVFLEGQLMERATGRSLQSMITRGEISLASSDKRKHFTNIVRGLFNIIQEMQAHNLVHRDLKPENIFYDSQTGKVTLLDFGSAERLRKKEKADDGTHLHASTSTQLGGTPKYISPKVLQQKSHGSEADLFSFAMTVLELVNSKDFIIFAHERFPNIEHGDKRDTVFATCEPAEYLNQFLKTIGKKNSPLQSNSLPTQPSFIGALLGWSSGSDEKPSSNRNRAQSMGLDSPASRGDSKTEGWLKRHPEVRAIIDLAFQASEGGEKGAAAYGQLRQLPYFQTESSPPMTDSPTITASSAGTDSPPVMGVSR